MIFYKRVKLQLEVIAVENYRRERNNNTGAK